MKCTAKIYRHQYERLELKLKSTCVYCLAARAPKRAGHLLELRVHVGHAVLERGHGRELLPGLLRRLEPAVFQGFKCSLVDYFRISIWNQEICFGLCHSLK